MRRFTHWLLVAVSVLAGACDLLPSPVDLTIRGPTYSIGAAIANQNQDVSWLFGGGAPPPGFVCFYSTRFKVSGGHKAESVLRILGASVSTYDLTTGELLAHYGVDKQTMTNLVGNEEMFSGDDAPVDFYVYAQHIPFRLEMQVHYYDDSNQRTTSATYTSECRAP